MEQKTIQISTQQDWDALSKERLDAETKLEIRGGGLRLNLVDSSPDIEFFAPADPKTTNSLLTLRGTSHPSIVAGESQPVIRVEGIAYPSIRTFGDSRPVITAAEYSRPQIEVGEDSRAEVVVTDKAEPLIVTRDSSVTNITALDASKAHLETRDASVVRLGGDDGASVDLKQNGSNEVSVLYWDSFNPNPLVVPRDLGALEGAVRAGEVTALTPGGKGPVQGQ